MASKRSRASAAPNATARFTEGPDAAKGPTNSLVLNNRQDARHHRKSWHQLFSDMACAAAHYAGHPLAFLTAFFLVIVWAITGPLFKFRDTWQLVINTS